MFTSSYHNINNDDYNTNNTIHNDNNHNPNCRLPEYIEKYTKDLIFKDILLQSRDEKRKEKEL